LLKWTYNNFGNIYPDVKTQNGFAISVRKGGNSTEEMRFSSDHRADILTEALRFADKFFKKSVFNKKFNCFKQHWSEAKKSVILELTPFGIIQVDPTTEKTLTYYDYKNIDYITTVSDVPQAFIIATDGFNRMHMFQCEQRENIIKSIIEFAANCIGVSIRFRKESIVIDDFWNNKFGKFSADDCITSLAEFTVYKVSNRTSEPVRRILCLTEVCLLERDPGSYSICTLKPLGEIFAIIRSESNPQEFRIEYMRGPVRVYTSSDRDSLLASLIDGVRASGNRDICIKMSTTQRGLRLGPFSAEIDEKVESLHMKFLQEPPTGSNIDMNEILVRFNVNVPYSGLINAVTQEKFFAENKEKLITSALIALKDFDPQSACSSYILEQEFHVLRRLVASKYGYKAFTNLPGLREAIGRKVMKALKREEDGLTYSAIELLNALMQPMHNDYELKQEQLNKASLLSSKKFLEGILKILTSHVKKGSGALVVSTILDFLTYSICPPFSETTDGDHFDTLLEMVAENGRVFYKLFQHQSMAIVKGAGLIMKAIIEEGTNELAIKMQSLALSEGALPRHLHTAMYTQSVDTRMLTMRQLSRSLVALWCTSNDIAIALLRRILPSGLWQFLYSLEKAPKDRDLINIRDNLSLAIEHNTEVNQTKKMQIINKSKRLQRQIMNTDSVKLIEKQLSNVMQHWKQRVGTNTISNNTSGSGTGSKADDKVIVLRRRRQRIKSTENWDLFYYKFNLDHAKPNLIWNFKCREELREAIENEIRAFTIDKELGQGFIIAWNYIEFEVPYHCLDDEVKIGEYYLRLLLEQGNDIFDNIQKNLKTSAGLNDGITPIIPNINPDDKENEIKNDNTSIKSETTDEQQPPTDKDQSQPEIKPELIESELEIQNSTQFFNDLYHRFLLSTNMKAMCLQAMTIVYTKCHEEIGPFNDTKFIMLMLDRATDKLERDRLLMFIDALILNRTNVKEILDAGGIRILVDLLTLAHLHTTRAYVPSQTNVIEASSEMIERDQEKEWYYGQKVGPFSFKELCDLYRDGTIENKTRCWAQGLDGWRPMDKIPQLKWTLLATGTAHMNETTIAILILNIFIKMCGMYPSRDEDGAIIRPLPRIKRLLSESTCLPHIVQLLLTFDPIIVEKISTLLYLVVQDNPIMSRLYITGVFFFISMYNGSNVLPIGRFLEFTHMKQAFRSDEAQNERKSDLAQRSILGHIFPESMICYLENHGYEKFASIYLGEFDTPEAIWNGEMRRYMIEKIAGHLADFSPRLQSNTRAQFQYSQIPVIMYPQLENELFCSIYYLKHLCDERKFPNWNISKPVNLLKECLLAWKGEIEKKPPTMSRNDCYLVLELITPEQASSGEQLKQLPDESKVIFQFKFSLFLYSI
jgi:hypothetical protein